MDRGFKWIELFAVLCLTIVCMVFAWRLLNPKALNESGHEIQKLNFFSGKIYLKKQYCSFSDDKNKCVLKGFWIAEPAGIFTQEKYILYLKKDGNSTSILTLVYNPDGNSGQINALEFKKAYKVEYDKTDRKIVKDPDGFQKDFKKIYGDKTLEAFINS